MGPFFHISFPRQADFPPLFPFPERHVYLSMEMNLKQKEGIWNQPCRGISSPRLNCSLCKASQTMFLYGLVQTSYYLCTECCAASTHYDRLCLGFEFFHFLSWVLWASSLTSPCRRIIFAAHCYHRRRRHPVRRSRVFGLLSDVGDCPWRSHIICRYTVSTLYVLWDSCTE